MTVNDQDQELKISEIKTELDDLYSESTETFGLQLYSNCFTLLGSLQADIAIWELAKMEGNKIKQHNTFNQCVRSMVKLQTNPVAKYLKQKAAEQKEKPAMNTQTSEEEKTIGELHKEAAQEQRAVFPAVANEEGLCLSVGLNDRPSINAVSGNRYAPVETVSFVDPSMPVEVKTDQIGDTLVACVARMRKLRFIVYSCDGAKYFHILGAGQSMTGLYNSVVNDKVVYWVVNSDLKEELVILDTPKMNPVGGWVQKEDLLHLILPLYRGISSSTSLDLVLEAALRCASFQAIESYLTWAENYSEYKYIYPDTQQTLKHLQGG